MEIYGLTGKTGSGKTTVAKLLSEKGFYVVDGDILARRVTEKGSEVLKELSDFFGEDIISEDGTLIRQELARRAFSTEEARQNLNRITHAAIHKLFVAETEKAEKEGFEYCLFDAAALLESPSKSICKKIIVVYAPYDVRLQRILKRDGISETDAKRRMDAQKSDEYYLSNADIIINNFPPHDLEAEINKVTD